MERIRTANVLLIASLTLGACARKADEFITPEAASIAPPGDGKPLATPTIVSPTPTEAAVTPAVDRIVNPLTGAVYQVTQNPEGKSGRCVKLGKYTNLNKQTVFGAATVLGPDRGEYGDFREFKVYGVDGTVIGSFTTDSLPDSGRFGTVLPGTVVCED